MLSMCAAGQAAHLTSAPDCRAQHQSCRGHSVPTPTGRLKATCHSAAAQPFPRALSVAFSRSSIATARFLKMHGSTAGRPVVAAASGPSDVFVLDFDGVLVDSEPEVSMAGYLAAKAYWTEHVREDRKQQILEGLAVARPVLVSGWETMIIARICAEDASAGHKIVEDWPGLMDRCVQAWGIDIADMRRVFEETRNRWMDVHEDEFLSLAKPYQNVVNTLQYTELPFYIVSSKAAHRISRVASKQLGLDLPEDSPRLFAGLIPPEERKIAAIRTIADRPLVKEGDAKMHFVDDRFETVKAVAADAGLRDGPGKLQVYFADWGYSTAEERVAAQNTEGVRSITLAQFNELVKWGILMGVDDGCGDDN